MRKLQCKFGEVPLHYRDIIDKADLDSIMLWAEILIDASSLQDIFELVCID